MADFIFNREDVTLGDIEDAEALSGNSVLVEFQRGNLSAKSFRVLVGVVRHRLDPSFAVDDARDVRVVDFGAPAADPTPGAAA